MGASRMRGVHGRMPLVPARFKNSSALARTVATAAVTWAALTAFGCGQREGGKPESGKAITYPAGLSSSSTPTQVAESLIKALDGRDKAVLLGLVATQAASADIEKIYRKYGRKSPLTPEKVAATVASGWGATYAFLQKGATRVLDERVDGDKATVRAVGRNASTGKPRLLIITLIREEDVWKVKAGLQSAEPPPGL